MLVGSPLWNRLFGDTRDVQDEELGKAKERLAEIRDLVSRQGFRSEVIGWIQEEISRARVLPGKHEDMLYRTGVRDGLEIVLARMKHLQEVSKESYDD